MKKQVTLIIPPKIEAMISGVPKIESNHPTYTLFYCNGETETAECPEITVNSTYFNIVSAVQSKRAKA